MNEDEIVRVKITWTYETDVPRKYLNNRTIEDVTMEAFTQGDGSTIIEVVE